MTQTTPPQTNGNRSASSASSLTAHPKLMQPSQKGRLFHFTLFHFQVSEI
jgi:hypothetical protein